MKKTLKSVMVAILLFSFSFVSLEANSGPSEKLGATNWQGTTVTDMAGHDVTAENTGFIGLAKYEAATNRYEFFDKETKETRGDRGVYFVTQDGKKRILISELGYHAVVDMTELTDSIFTYTRMGVLKDGSAGLVSVEHIPYDGELFFTTTLPPLEKETGEIDTSVAGRDILASTYWQGTVASDKDGNDVSAYNQGYLGLARYEAETGRYEFFDKTTGASRGDYGYYDVTRNNKVRAHVSLGFNYAAALELTEINSGRFTYSRIGKDADGNDIEIFVAHEPYTGSFPLEFTFGNETVTPVSKPVVHDVFAGDTVVTGTAAAGLQIVLDDDASLLMALSSTTVATDGTWSIPLASPAVAGNTLSVFARDLSSGATSEVVVITVQEKVKVDDDARIDDEKLANTGANDRPKIIALLSVIVSLLYLYFKRKLRV